MSARSGPDPIGLRVVMDSRPLEDPDRSPITAIYLAELLAAYDAEPLEGESFAFLVGLHRPDPTTAFGHLIVAARRRMPPSRLLRSAALTVDPFLLRGAAIGSAWWAEQSGASGAVFHTASGAIPIASRLPLVVTLLDLAPWELPGVYQRSPAAAFGQRLRGQILRDAQAVIVGTEAVGRAAQAVLSIRPERIVVIPLAARAAFHPSASGSSAPGSAAGGRPTERRPRSQGPGGRLRWLARPSLRSRTARTARALPRLLRPLRRPAGPRLAPRGACPAGRRGSSGRPRSGRGLATPSPAHGRLARRPGGPRPGLGPAARRRAPGLRPGPLDRAIRGARGAARGRRSCPRSASRPGCRRSRRSPPARRSSPARSEPCRRSWALPGSWSSPVTPIEWRPRSRRPGPTTTCGSASGPRRSPGADPAAEAGPMWPGRRGWPTTDVGARRGPEDSVTGI